MTRYLSFVPGKVLVLAVMLTTCPYTECQRPICRPRSLPHGPMEVFDPEPISAGVTMTPICTELSEPKIQATVHPSYYALFKAFNTTNEIFHVGYKCVGSATVARNLTNTLPRGVGGVWTTPPLGYKGDDLTPLAIGDRCTFFGCYEYTTRWLDENFRLQTMIHVKRFNNTSCLIDKDECSDGSAHCEHECVNFVTGTNNSYQCVCRHGFSLSQDQHNCTDADECALGADNCDQICTADDAGWYNCSCIEGYTLNHNRHSCDDIDECRSNGTALCDTEVTGRNCSNTPGSYQCLCPEGFYYHEEEHLCKDIDECSLGSSLCQHQCVNTNGGYTCICDKWHARDGDYKCKEVDVCIELAFAADCGSHSHCVSHPKTKEGYQCVCDSGYEQNMHSMTCTLTGIVHVYWVVPLLTVVSILLLLGCIYFLLYKYHHQLSKHYLQK